MKKKKEELETVAGLLAESVESKKKLRDAKEAFSAFKKSLEEKFEEEDTAALFQMDSFLLLEKFLT